MSEDIALAQQKVVQLVKCRWTIPPSTSQAETCSQEWGDGVVKGPQQADSIVDATTSEDITIAIREEVQSEERRKVVPMSTSHPGSSSNEPGDRDVKGLPQLDGSSDDASKHSREIDGSRKRRALEDDPTGADVAKRFKSEKIDEDKPWLSHWSQNKKIWEISRLKPTHRSWSAQSTMRNPVTLASHPTSESRNSADTVVQGDVDILVKDRVDNSKLSQIDRSNANRFEHSQWTGANARRTNNGKNSAKSSIGLQVESIVNAPIKNTRVSAMMDVLMKYECDKHGATDWRVCRIASGHLDARCLKSISENSDKIGAGRTQPESIDSPQSVPRRTTGPSTTTEQGRMNRMTSMESSKQRGPPPKGSDVSEDALTTVDVSTTSKISAASAFENTRTGQEQEAKETLLDLEEAAASISRCLEDGSLPLMTYQWAVENIIQRDLFVSFLLEQARLRDQRPTE